MICYFSRCRSPLVYNNSVFIQYTYKGYTQRWTSWAPRGMTDDVVILMNSRKFDGTAIAAVVCLSAVPNI